MGLMDSQNTQSEEEAASSDAARYPARAEAIQATILLFLSSALYVHQYFFRVLPGTMQGKWADEFGLETFEISNVVACFFYAYLFTQPVAGVLVARFGGASVLFFASLAGLGGALFLANASVVEHLYGSQLLIGAGGGFSLVIALSAGRRAVKEKNYALFSGVVIATGALGAMIGQAPLAYASSIYDWRTIVFSTTIIEIIIVIAAAVLMWRGKRQPLAEVRASAQSGNYSRLKQTITDRNVWAFSFFGFFLFLPMASFVNVWLLPFISLELGQHSFFSSFSSTVVYMGYIVGGPILGWIIGMFPLRKVQFLIGASGLGLIMSLGILYIQDSYVPVVYPLLFGMGFVMSSATIAITLVRDRIPADRLPIALGIMMCLLNLGGTLALASIGYILDFETINTRMPDLHDYHIALAFIPIGFSIAFAIACLISRKGTDKLT